MIFVGSAVGVKGLQNPDIFDEVIGVRAIANCSAKGLQKVGDPFKVLGTAKTHKDIDPSSPPIAIHYVHTAPLVPTVGN